MLYLWQKFQSNRSHRVRDLEIDKTRGGVLFKKLFRSSACNRTAGFHDTCSPDSCPRDSCSPVISAPEAQIRSQLERKLIFCLALTHTYIIVLICVLTLTQNCAYTLNYMESKCRWGASVAGEQVSGEHQSCYH